VEASELRLVVEQLQVARSAGHEQEDHALGLRRVVRLSGHERIGDGRGIGGGAAVEEFGEGEGAEPDGALLEEPAASDLLRVAAVVEMVLAIHRFRPLNEPLAARQARMSRKQLLFRNCLSHQLCHYPVMYRLWSTAPIMPPSAVAGRSVPFEMRHG